MGLRKKFEEWESKAKQVETLRLMGKEEEAKSRYEELEIEALSSVELDDRDSYPLPNDALPVEDHILFPDWRKRDCDQDPRPYQFNFRVEVPEYSSIDKQQIVDESWKVAQALDLSTLRGSLEYGLRWSSKDFQKATDFPGGFSGKIEIMANQSVAHPSTKTNSVFGPKFSSHGVNVTTEGPIMKVSAEGLYRAHLGEMAADINFQIITLELSLDDAQRLLRKEGAKRSDASLSRLERALVPNERRFSASAGSEGLVLSPSKTVELNILAKDLGYWEDFLCKPLASVSPNHVSGIKYLQKNYGPVALMSGQRLRDLKIIASRLEGIDLGILNYNPLIGDSEAKELLGHHLEWLRNNALGDKSWTPPENLWGLLSKYHGPIFARRVGYISSTPGESERVVSILKEKGYEPSDVPSGDWYSYQPGLHVVEFLRQQHAREPSLAIDAVKKEYRNRNYGVDVRAVVAKIPLAKMRSIIFPPESTLYMFNINEWQGNVSSRFESDSYNNLFVENCGTMFSKRGNVNCSANLARPALLDSQETALRLAGLKINK